MSACPSFIEFLETCMNIMPIDATQLLYFLISYHQ